MYVNRYTGTTTTSSFGPTHFSLHPYDCLRRLLCRIYVRTYNRLVHLLRMGSPEIQKALKRRLTAVVRNPLNRTCCDCTDRASTWASILCVDHSTVPTPPGARDLVVFLCRSCAECHAKLGPEISHVIRVELEECKKFGCC